MKWTPHTLFRSRVARFWAEQYRVWRTALDWTVWLYFIVPGLLFAGGTYRDWWLDLPAWLTGLPDPLAAVPPLLLVLAGQLRVYAEDADILFLRQRPVWIKGLIGYGTAYSFVMSAIQTVLLFGLQSVWIVKAMGLGWTSIALWMLFTASCRTVFSIVKNLIRSRWTGWRRYAVTGGASIAMAGLYLVPVLRFLSTQNNIALSIGALVALAALPAAIAVKMRAKGTFMNDVLMERLARLASTDLLLSAAIERKPTVRLRRPLVFRMSGRLFRGTDAGTMLAEMRLKAFLRKWKNVQLWIGFYGASSGAVLLSPGWLQFPLVAALSFLAAYWIHEQWKEWFAEPFIQQFRWEDSAAIKGSSLSRFWLLLPGAGWLAAVAGWSAGGWLFAAAGAVCGAVFGWIVNRVLEEVASPASRDR